VIPTFVIFLREGIEASMIVAILLAYLERIGQRRHFRDVFGGVVAALVVSLGGGIAAFFLIRHYEGSNVQTYFETATYLLAAVILTYMTFWMQLHAKVLAKELADRSDLALSKGKRGGSDCSPSRPSAARA
jgi:high-affinity iron transporter